MRVRNEVTTKMDLESIQIVTPEVYDYLCDYYNEQEREREAVRKLNHEAAKLLGLRVVVSTFGSPGSWYGPKTVEQNDKHVLTNKADAELGRMCREFRRLVGENGAVPAGSFRGFLNSPSTDDDPWE